MRPSSLFQDLNLTIGPVGTAQDLAGHIKQLSKDGKDLAPVEKALTEAKERAEKAKLEAEQKAKLEQTLQGVAEVKKMGNKSRRFILVTSYNGDIQSHEGIAYSNGEVEVQDRETLPTYGEASMERFLKELRGNAYEAHVLYLD